MPQLGVGLVPGGAIGQEYQNLLRRVFARTVVVLLYKSSPLLAIMLRNAEKLSGGLSPFTQPVQTGSYVSSSWTGPAGNFAVPADSAQEANAEFNLCGLLTPVSYYGLETLVAKDATAVTSRLALKMNDMKNSALASLSSALFGSNAANTATQMYGLLDAYDDGTSVTTYGGLSRSTYTGWKGTKVTSAGAILTRAAMIPQMLRVVKASGGDALDFMVTSIEDWTTLLTDFMSVERYNTDPRSAYGKDDPINAGFRGLMLGDTPIFFDPNLAAGTAIGFNSSYIGLGVHEDANFAWTGWQSTLGNMQIGYVGAQVTALNLVCKKPSTGILIEGITGGQSW